MSEKIKIVDKRNNVYKEVTKKEWEQASQYKSTRNRYYVVPSDNSTVTIKDEPSFVSDNSIENNDGEERPKRGRKPTDNSLIQ